MASERQIQEVVARCVATMVLYHNEVRGRNSTHAMKAEVRAIASFVSGLGLGTAQSDQCILHPVEAELHARYGHELGTRIYNEFVGAFDRSTGPDPILSTSPV